MLRDQLELHFDLGVKVFEGNEWRLRISGLGKVVSGDCCVHNNQRSGLRFCEGRRQRMEELQPQRDPEKVKVHGFGHSVVSCTQEIPMDSVTARRFENVEFRLTAAEEKIVRQDTTLSAIRK